jgi:hypothetical protein
MPSGWGPGSIQSFSPVLKCFELGKYGKYLYKNLETMGY